MDSFQEIITGEGHSSAIDWWALGKYMEIDFSNLVSDCILDVLLHQIYITHYYIATAYLKVISPAEEKISRVHKISYSAWLLVSFILNHRGCYTI